MSVFSAKLARPSSFHEYCIKGWTPNIELDQPALVAREGVSLDSNCQCNSMRQYGSIRKRNAVADCRTNQAADASTYGLKTGRIRAT